MHKPKEVDQLKHILTFIQGNMDEEMLRKKLMAKRADKSTVVHSRKDK